MCVYIPLFTTLGGIFYADEILLGTQNSNYSNISDMQIKLEQISTKQLSWNDSRPHRNKNGHHEKSICRNHGRGTFIITKFIVK